MGLLKRCGEEEIDKLYEEYERAAMERMAAEVRERLAYATWRKVAEEADDRNRSLRTGSPV